MNGLSLFSGAGIGELALKQIIPNYRTVGYVEWDTYCQEVIRARIQDGVLDDAPIFNDIRVFNERFASRYVGRVDWVSAGFPCQPFSVAGRRTGEADERNMWPATLDAISIIRPSFAFLENVPDLLTTGYERSIFADLAEIGYDCEWDIVPAAFVGAPHLRKRLWILAYPRHWTGRDFGIAQAGNNQEARRSASASAAGRSGEQPETVADALCQQDKRNDSARLLDQSTRGGETVADTDSSRQSQSQRIEQDERRRVSDGDSPDSNAVCERLEGVKQAGAEARPVDLSSDECNSGWWAAEPGMGRVVDGLAYRVDRLKALGNGWVPQVVARILQVNSSENQPSIGG